MECTISMQKRLTDYQIFSVYFKKKLKKTCQKCISAYICITKTKEQ